MTPAACLPVNPGESVLDLCAAPGGKATALGAALKGQGLLIANDISVDVDTGKLNLKPISAGGWKVSVVDTGADTMTSGRIRRLRDWAGSAPERDAERNRESAAIAAEREAIEAAEETYQE